MRDTIAARTDGSTDTATQPPAVAETHVGLVVMVGDRAYKTKKAVRTAFLDFSTPEQRRPAGPAANR